jgi:GNAT superfamily N-acetyltransferase
MTNTTTSTEPLTTGWEADLPVADTLLRRFVHNHADRLARAAEAGGGRTESCAAALFADLPCAFPFDNAVVLLRPPTAVDLAAVTARAKNFFPAGRPWVLLSMWPTPDLSALGLRLVGHPPLMLRTPGPWPAPPAELRIVEVRDAAAEVRFARTLADAYPISPAPDTTTGRHEAEMRLFIGEVAGQPVGVAGAAVAHGLVEIDRVAMLPHARRRGYGTALTAAAGAVASHLPAVLLATDPGRPVYHRLGFIDLFRATIWEVRP